MLKNNGLVISEEKNGVLDLFGEPAHQPKDSRLLTTFNGKGSKGTPSRAEMSRLKSVEFTELMSGFIHRTQLDMVVDKKAVYESAFRAAKGRGEIGRLLVSVSVFKDHELENESQPSGMFTGTFVCPTIEGSPFTIAQGDLGLFKKYQEVTGTSRLTYEGGTVGTNGRRLHFCGYKVVDASVSLSPLQMWRSTTTLYVSITERATHKTMTIANYNEGILEENIFVLTKMFPFQSVRNWLRVASCVCAQRTLSPRWMTLSPSGRDVLRKAKNMTRFLTFCASKSVSHLLTPLAPLEYADERAVLYVNHTPPTQTFTVISEDGIETQLHMWEPNPNAVATDSNGAPVKIENLFMIPGSSVDHQIFALPTIPFNAVNYFTRAGYRVWVTVYRICQLKSTHRQPWTTYDSRLDIKACYEHIRKTHAWNWQNLYNCSLHGIRRFLVWPA